MTNILYDNNGKSIKEKVIYYSVVTSNIYYIEYHDNKTSYILNDLRTGIAKPNTLNNSFSLVLRVLEF